MAVVPKMTQGMAMMKYALNHPWHFFSYKLAMFTTLLQTTMVFYFEAVKIYALLQSPDAETVIFRFVAMAIIIKMDDYFYYAISERNSKEFIQKFWNEEELCEKDEDEFDETCIDFEVEGQYNQEAESMVFLPI